MKITRTSKELTVKEKYMLTKAPTVQRMKNCVGQRIEIDAYAFYTDVNKDGEETEILSVLTPEGEVFATNSPTFKKDFLDMVDMFADSGEEIKAVRVVGGKSKAGRDFITCVYAD